MKRILIILALLVFGVGCNATSTGDVTMVKASRLKATQDGRRLFWYMRGSVEEERYFRSWGTHIICRTPWPGSATMKGQARQTLFTSRWERFDYVAKNSPLEMVIKEAIFPNIASATWYANHDPTRVSYWTNRVRVLKRHVRRVLAVRDTVTTMTDWEVHGRWRDTLDETAVLKAALAAGFTVDIGYPYSPYRDQALIGSRLMGTEQMGTRYSPHNPPAREGSEITQIIVMANGAPNPSRRFTVDQAVQFLRDNPDLDVMLFADGDAVEVARQMAAAMGRVGWW